MKEITKEKVQKYTVYQAVDGTEFNDIKECKQYEESALGVLRGKLKPLIVNDQYDCWALLGGNEDNKCLAIKMSTEQDVDTVLQNYYLDAPWILKDLHKDVREKLVRCLNQAYAEKDIVLFGLNCDDRLYFIDTRNNIMSRLNSLDEKEEKE